MQIILITFIDNPCEDMDCFFSEISKLKAIYRHSVHVKWHEFRNMIAEKTDLNSGLFWNERKSDQAYRNYERLAYQEILDKFHMS